MTSTQTSNNAYMEAGTIDPNVVHLPPSMDSSHKRARSLSPSAEPSKRARVASASATESTDGDDAERKLELAWAQSRQALCDALPFFKSHQGGTYTKDHKVFGLLIAAFIEPGDFVGRDKIITTMGGDRQLSDESWVRGGHEPKTLKGWEDALERQNPVGCIIDRKHPMFDRIDLAPIPAQDSCNVSYVVLGFFFVTKIWVESVQPKNAQKPYLVWKIMLQRIDIENAPAYWKAEAADGVDEVKMGVPEKQTFCAEQQCNSCSKTSPIIFDNQPFVCLDSGCPKFFEANGVALVQTEDNTLKYSEDFIQWFQPYTQDKSKIPAVFQAMPDINEHGFGTEKALRMGMTCPLCGCCSRRNKWDGWSCENCDFFRHAFPLPYPLEEVQRESDAYTAKLRKSSASYRDDNVTIQIDKGFVEKKQPRIDGDTTVTEYIIQNREGEIIGSLVHSRPNDALKALTNGADQVFKEIQEKDLGLIRNPVRCTGSTKEVLVRHFQGNWGFPYDFGVKVKTSSFDKADDVILKMMAQLTHFGQQATRTTQKTISEGRYKLTANSTIMDKWFPHNELLLLGYMESDSISWHDDGEEQLLGIITTLSFGSPAEMHLRLKQDGKKGSKKGGKKEDLLLKIQLLHGDSLTMCDTRLQAFTDHAVLPKGLRRFAATGRGINPDYYTKPGNAQKLSQAGISLDQAKACAEIPSRASNFPFSTTIIGNMPAASDREANI